MIVRWKGETPHVLLIRDAYQHWGLPKGHLEAGETPACAALREVREETGLGDLVLGPALHTIDWFFRARGRLIHKYCHFYLIEAPTGETCPQAAEGITACAWVPLLEALDQISYDNAREVLRRAVDEISATGRLRLAPAASSPPTAPPAPQPRPRPDR